MSRAVAFLLGCLVGAASVMGLLFYEDWLDARDLDREWTR